MPSIDLVPFAVAQRRPHTGCIVTSYEILLRAAGVTGIDLDAFQDDFDLDALGTGRNSFSSVAAAIAQRYPAVKFKAKTFITGAEKLDFVDNYLSRGKAVLLSVAKGPRGDWHIMPVLAAAGSSYTLLVEMRSDGTPCTLTLSRAELIRRHDEWPGGDDVAFLE
jgi:hypothetical protein